jgi:hypothetical protein
MVSRPESPKPLAVFYGMQTGVLTIKSVTSMSLPESIGLMKSKKWTEFLMSLKVGKAYSFVFDTPRDLESCRAVGWRINARNECGRTFSFESNYPQRSLVIQVNETPQNDAKTESDATA